MKLHRLQVLVLFLFVTAVELQSQEYLQISHNSVVKMPMKFLIDVVCRD